MVYSDGLFFNESTGSALIYGGQVFSYHLHNFNSVYTADPCAIYQALPFTWQQPRQYYFACTYSVGTLHSLMTIFLKIPSLLKF